MDSPKKKPEDDILKKVILSFFKKHYKTDHTKSSKRRESINKLTSKRVHPII